MHEKALIILGFSAIIALIILFTTPLGGRTPVSDNGGNNAGGTELTLCRATGCSGQVCAEEDVMTTCEYREEYSCYQSARCERQQDGKCGWTETSELMQCLSRSSAVAI